MPNCVTVSVCFNESNEQILMSSLTSAFDAFRVHLKAAGRSSSTIACYLSSLDRLKESLGDVRLNHITLHDLEQALVNPAEYRENAPSRSPVTLNRIKSSYRSFFRWSHETGLVADNPAARLLLANTQPRLTVPITLEEIERLLAVIRKSNDLYAARDGALFATYAFTGIRRSEALALRINDYDPMAMNLNLPRTKGGGKRVQPVISKLAAILQRHIVRLSRYGAGDLSPLFPGRQPCMALSARQVQNRFDRWKKSAGLRDVLTIHSFRAGFATCLYRKTNNLLLVSIALGHRNVSTTKQYIRLDVSALRDSMERAVLIQ